MVSTYDAKHVAYEIKYATLSLNNINDRNPPCYWRKFYRKLSTLTSSPQFQDWVNMAGRYPAEFKMVSDMNHLSEQPFELYHQNSKKYPVVVVRRIFIR